SGRGRIRHRGGGHRFQRTPGARSGDRHPRSGARRRQRRGARRSARTTRAIDRREHAGRNARDRGGAGEDARAAQQILHERDGQTSDDSARDLGNVMPIIEAIVLGLVQGLTEFIPISSTAHLEIVPVLLGWGDPGAAASAVIQFGTWLAAVIYFFRDIVRLVTGFFRGLFKARLLADVDSPEAWLGIIGTTPIASVGLMLKEHIESTSRGLWVVTTMVIVVAILMILAEAYAKRRQPRQFDQLNVTDAVTVGLGQCLALIPGSSRSGSTIMAALFRGV